MLPIFTRSSEIYLIFISVSAKNLAIRVFTLIIFCLNKPPRLLLASVTNLTAELYLSLIVVISVSKFLYIASDFCSNTSFTSNLIRSSSLDNFSNWRVWWCSTLSLCAYMRCKRLSKFSFSSWALSLICYVTSSIRLWNVSCSSATPSNYWRYYLSR